jgi:hypothetical protein
MINLLNPAPAFGVHRRLQSYQAAAQSDAGAAAV